MKFDLKEDLEYLKEHLLLCKWVRFMVKPPGLEKASRWEQIKLYVGAAILTAIILGVLWWLK